MDHLPAPKPYSIADVEEKSPRPEEGNCIRSLREALSREFDSTVRRTEECVEKSFVSKSGGLEAVLLGEATQADALLDALRAAAVEALNVLCDSIDPIALLVSSDDNPEAAAKIWGKAIRAAQEMAVDQGALRQTLLTAPESLDSLRILDLTDQAGGPTPTIVKNPIREIVFCTETSNLSLAQTAANLIRNRPDVSDVAHRLRTRIDVEWAPLPAVEIEV
jgi:hypothetical protein